MKFSKKLKKKSKDESHKSLRYHLHKQLYSVQRARTTKRVHASEMLKTDLFNGSMEFCPREYALLDVLKKRRPDEVIQTCSQMVFHFGDAVADIIIDTFAKAGMAVGHWRCCHCEELYKFQKRPYECSECHHDKFDYLECRFTSKDTGVSCGLDLLVTTPEKKHRIVEIKSIKDEEFKKLEGPLAEHKFRTNLYMRIVETSKSPRSKRIKTDEASILYVSKGGYGCKDTAIRKEGIKDGPFSPFKEFIVKRDDEMTDTKWYHAEVLNDFRNGERGLMKGVCSNMICNRAQQCSVGKECFSGDYPFED